MTSILREKTGEEIPLIVDMGGPVSLSSRLLGTYNFLTWTLRKPEVLKECLEVTGAVCSVYAEILLEAGMDAVCIIDGIAGPDKLDPRDFNTLIRPEIKNSAMGKDKASAAILKYVPKTLVLDLSVD